nr:hypothetical protein [Tanacetum cinerariifolium]
VGTIRDFTFGDGVAFSSGKNKIVPSADGGSVYKQTITYNCKGNDKPSEEVLNSEKSDHEKTFKAMEAYAAAHPELY